MSVTFVKNINGHFINGSIEFNYRFTRKQSFIHLSSENGFRYLDPTYLCYYLKTDGIGGGGGKN